MDKEYLLTTKDLTKRQGRKVIIDRVNLHISQGAVYYLAGRDGAGKTTLLRLLAGLAAPSSGEISFFGKTGAQLAPYLSRMGVLIGTPGYYPNLTALQNLELCRLAGGMRQKDAPETLLELVHLRDAADQKVRTLTASMQKRLGLAMALSCAPDLLLLDDPADGLDSRDLTDLQKILSWLNREKQVTLLLTGHNPGRLSRIVTDYGILHQGALLQELSADALMENSQERILLHTQEPARACTVLEQMNIRDYKVIDRDTIEISDPGADSNAIVVHLVAEHVNISEIMLQNMTPEDHFQRLIEGGDRHA